MISESVEKYKTKVKEYSTDHKVSLSISFSRDLIGYVKPI